MESAMSRDGANLRTNPHGRMKQTADFVANGPRGRATLEFSTDPQPFARCNRTSPCGHSSIGACNQTCGAASCATRDS